MLDKSEAPAGWHQLAERVLGGQRLAVEEGLAILRSPDEELLEIMAAAYRVRQRWFGNRVHLNFLINAKSGRCGEDCGYCSQSKFSATEISEYEILDEYVLDGKTGSVACVAVLRTLMHKTDQIYYGVGGKCFFPYRWYRDQWEGVYRTNRSNGIRGFDDELKREQDRSAQYLKRVEEGYIADNTSIKRLTPAKDSNNAIPQQQPSRKKMHETN